MKLKYLLNNKKPYVQQIGGDLSNKKIILNIDIEELTTSKINSLQQLLTTNYRYIPIHSEINIIYKRYISNILSLDRDFDDNENWECDEFDEAIQNKISYKKKTELSIRDDYYISHFIWNVISLLQDNKPYNIKINSIDPNNKNDFFQNIPSETILSSPIKINNLSFNGINLMNSELEYIKNLQDETQKFIEDEENYKLYKPITNIDIKSIFDIDGNPIPKEFDIDGNPIPKEFEIDGIFFEFSKIFKNNYNLYIIIYVKCNQNTKQELTDKKIIRIARKSKYDNYWRILKYKNFIWVYEKIHIHIE